jgi:hypothetical protein
MNRLSLATAVFCTFLTVPGFGSDVVVLRGGSSLRGLILDHRSTDEVIKFRTDRGELPVLRGSIERIERDDDMDRRYWLAREYYDETAEGFYELALWCDANQLEEARDEHLNDALRLDPNHAGARQRLGFVRRGREWVPAAPAATSQATPPESAASDGAVAGRSATRRSELTEVLQKRQDAVRKQQAIHDKVMGIAARLESNNPTHVRKARLDLAEIRDPLAIGPLTKAMQNASVPNRVRMVEAIGEIPEPEAAYALAIFASIDVSFEVRRTAIDAMATRPDQRDRFIPVLEQALRSEKIGLVENGAEALELLDEHQSVPRLIEALTVATRSTPNPIGQLTTEPPSNWVRGIKFTDVFADQRSVPMRAPS